MHAGGEMGKHWRSTVAIVGIGVAAVLSPSDVTGQVPFIDLGLSQSYTSSDALRTPVGISIVVGGLGLLGPLGLEASYRDMSEDGGQITQTCLSAPCTGAIFDRSYSLRTIGLGISYDIENPTDVMLTLGVHGATNRQTEHLRDLDTGERFAHDGSDSDFSYGLSVDLRLRPVVSRIRPAFTIRYDRVSANTCAADAGCFGGRNVFAISAGVSWVQRARR